MRDRFEIFCDAFKDKNLIELESEFLHNKFMNADEKRNLKMLVRNRISSASLVELLGAKKIGEYFIKNGCSDIEYYKNRLEKIEDRLKVL
tara:strand:- start:3694 stop:3963 length:270 start_codon:yes stop_codon:yes gene_type:complete